MLQSWLEIEPAQGRGLTVREPLDHAANVLRNRVWYRGDACELDQLFKQLADDPVSRARFWAAAPENEQIRKAHSGLPAVMVDTLAGIVRGDMEALRFDDPAAARRWQAVADENDFPALSASAWSPAMGPSASAWTLRRQRGRSWILPGPTGWSTSGGTAAWRRWTF